MDFQQDFPQIKSMKEKGITYLDSAATTLKHKDYLESFIHFESNSVANVHRGAHRLSAEATTAFEATRTSLANYLNADQDQIAFTKGTTDSVNLVAHSLEGVLQKNDCILLSEMEHHANLLPWQRLSKKTGARLLFIPVKKSGALDEEKAIELIENNPVRLLSISHVSNTLGAENPILSLTSLAKKHGALTFVDGAQSASLFKLDLKNTPSIDFFTFSAHKVFGPFGLGVLYAKDLAALPPYQLGGAIIKEVKLESSTFLDGPLKLEPGTPSISSVISFKPVVDFLSTLDFEIIRNEEKKLLLQAFEELKKIKGFQPLGDIESKINILSFNFEGVHPQDLCELLDEQGVALRSGHHCTQPLLKKLGHNFAARASLSIYNTEDDIENFIKATHKALKLLQ